EELAGYFRDPVYGRGIQDRRLRGGVLGRSDAENGDRARPENPNPPLASDVQHMPQSVYIDVPRLTGRLLAGDGQERGELVDGVHPIVRDAGPKTDRGPDDKRHMVDAVNIGRRPETRRHHPTATAAAAQHIEKAAADPSDRPH